MTVSAVETIEEYRIDEDYEVGTYITNHNHFLSKVEQFDDLIDGGAILGQAELAKMEYWYSKAQFYAYEIAGYHYGQYSLYESRAKQRRADMYERVRKGEYDPKLRSGTDAENIARRSEGEMLELAAPHKKQYLQWKGIAESYNQAINSVKDMFKGGKAEQRGNAFN